MIAPACRGEPARRRKRACFGSFTGSPSGPALRLLLLLGVSAWRRPCLAKQVTIYNDRPRTDVDGNVVDAHDGCILAHNGTYFLYGEAYGNRSLVSPYPWPDYPRLSVYTSPDLTTWTYRGPVLPESTPGTLWIPNVIWHEATQRFVMWYGSGGWATATSEDGVHFTPATPQPTPRFCNATHVPPGGKVDCRTDGTGLFVDDDGQGYVIFATSTLPDGLPSSPTHAGPGAGHVVTIERLTPDMLDSTHEGVGAEFFPDDYVESPALFKRGGVYFATYGSCCCGCDEGGGITVFTAPAVSGPWARQSPHADVNCNDPTALICGGYGARSQEDADLVYHAQWWGPSFIPLADGSTSVLFLGRRWLSGPGVPAGCHDICGNRGHPEACVSDYQMRNDLSVWYPLEFSDDGAAVLALTPSLRNFTLDLPE